MKLDKPANPNYCATVVRVKTLVDLPNADFLKGIPMFGMQAIVGLSTKVDELGIVFPAEVQLSEEFCRQNNLFRHTDLNLDPTYDKGYLEDNRRVRAIKLRGNRSDALYMPISSVNFAMGHNLQYDDPDGWMQLKEGDQFDTLKGVEICRKYERRVRSWRLGTGKLESKFKRVDAKLFPEHPDTAHFLRVDRNLDQNAYAVVTQKLHGTLLRVGNVPVARKLKLWERIARYFSAKIQKTEYAMVYGSHHVIKDANNPDQNHFYDEDIWTREGAKLDGLIPENYIVYGELVGWVGSEYRATDPNDVAGYYSRELVSTPIQKHYTYDCLPGTCKFYVYRVAVINNQGTLVDLSWPALKEFCQSAGLNHVVELWYGQLKNFHVENFLDVKFGGAAVPLSDDSPCDEGVCIRLEGMVPEIYKAKSAEFLQHETKMLDADVPDVEAEEHLWFVEDTDGDTI